MGQKDKVPMINVVKNRILATGSPIYRAPTGDKMGKIKRWIYGVAATLLTFGVLFIFFEFIVPFWSSVLACYISNILGTNN